MTMHPRRSPNPGNAGFTVVELLVVTLVGLILVMGVYQILISQSRLLTQQGEAVDARGSARAAAGFLSWELKTAAASGNDLYVISPDSLVLRSVQASGVICSWVTQGLNYRFGLRNTAGTFTANAGDSAMVFYLWEHSFRSYDVTGAWNGADSWLMSGGRTPVCFWGDSTTAAPRPEATIELPGSGVGVDRLTVGLRSTSSDGRSTGSSGETGGGGWVDR